MSLETSSEISQIASEVSARIANLEKLFEDDLKNEMADLKRTLVENPSAAALMKSEDVGILVRNLRRTVDAAVLAANTAKEKKTSAKKAANKVPLTKEVMQQALDEGFPE